uniref:Uncharacterized protein n=1 Tax=Anguilla anguilla TaxID=7936 RepID=A0A0E9V791_ANGAN
MFLIRYFYIHTFQTNYTNLRNTFPEAH